jgi:hypothetical protein
VISCACHLLHTFFATPKEFAFKEEVKRSINKTTVETLKNTPGKVYTQKAEYLFYYL